MAGESSSNEVQCLLQAITSSDVVENRIQLLAKLGESDAFEKSDLASVISSLTMFWEDFTCLDISQCTLNKTILHVAAKYLESDISGCLGHFLSLGIKASIWCEKHLKMTLMSTEESEEEDHSNHFFQLLLDLLSYSAACFSVLARYPVSDDKELMIVTEQFTFEQLNLTKVSISEIKRIQPFASEVLKVAQLVLDAVIRLCKVYSNAVNLDFVDARTEKDNNSTDCEEADTANHVINITKCTVKQLCELGVLAANDGGSLVTMLNLSWKGVVTLLQLGKGAFAMKLNVADILLTLVSLANESLRCAAETWFFLPLETVSVSEAKRIFLPVKFYLINAVRISSQYPCQAFSVYKDIALCVVMISTFKILLSKEHLKSASEVLVELLEPISFHFLISLLNSAQLKQEDKFLALDWLFNNESDLNFIPGDPSNGHKTTKMDAIFALRSDNMNSKILLLGRVSLFLNILKIAADLEEDMRLGIARKLGWLLTVLIDEEIYSSCLSLQIAIPYGSGKIPESVYQPLFFSILLSLKTFMIVISSSLAWSEMESFLLENIFHPHFLCWDIVMELWCFLVRHAEVDMVNDFIEKLCLLLISVASSESVLVPGSALRKVARSTCMLLMFVSQSTVDQVYSTIVGSNRSQSSSILLVALLMEGFPLNLLSHKMKSIATQRILTEYYVFIERFDDASLGVCGSGVGGAPVFALSAALQSLLVSISNIDIKILRFLVAVIHRYRNTVENSVKDHQRKLLSETLGIISNAKHLYASDLMEEVILELQNLFISGPGSCRHQLYQCKPNLATFMAGLGHTELVENDNSAKSSAVRELYHMLLREQHWAFVHLAMTAFGYFAARTSCNQLWRFVPQNAALSFDLDSGNEASEEGFLAELKAFLEKETALLTMIPSYDQLQLLVKEGLLLKEMVQKHQNTDLGAVGCDTTESDVESQANKRRKLPDGIREGVELLQSGLKVIGDGLPQLEQNHFDGAELHDKFMRNFSHLQEVIGQLAGIAGSV
ncbi:LOW QUALITY PROTEIN: uncharacterized protein LOC130782504 [Actinidia eriantha]|uniref:LOW QUALITY PROTEIN: uncharacterized protein LOC130782504 n=1 Tax=Actinidia eriantha TaxID=165200 RepID=UPI0025828E01|nr:LOW QUALITY PROTEIN: uncharacterized protein LOC130782504 [Actinidia eriantha]